MRALLTHGWRDSVYRDQDGGELYDLANDPHETHSFWDSAAHQTIRERLNHRLIARMISGPSDLS